MQISSDFPKWFEWLFKCSVKSDAAHETAVVKEGEKKEKEKKRQRQGKFDQVLCFFLPVDQLRKSKQ